MKRILLLFTVIVTIELSLSSCVTNPATGQKEIILIPPSEEIALGNKTYKEILNQYTIYRYKNLNNYIDSIGKKLIKYVQDKNIRYTFTLLNSPAINAFSTPGGYVYVTRGILAYLNNEAQLACVLGHELGHINAHHVANMLSKQMLFNLGMAIAYAKSKRFRKFAPFVGVAGNILFLSFSRQDEYQADYLGVEYATLAGYDATQMAKFFKELERIRNREHYFLPEFLSTHPSPPHREERIIYLSQQWKQIAKRKYYTVARDIYLKHINGILFGKNKKNGYTEGNRYYNPNMRFTFIFPKGWELIDMAHYIIITDRHQEGVWIKITLTKKNIYQAASSLANGIFLKYSTLNINGFDATEVVKPVKIGSFSGIEKAFFINFNGKTFAIIGLAPLALYPTYSYALSMVPMSFKKLTNPTKIKVKNTYIEVIKVQKNETFRKLLDNIHSPKKLRSTIYLINNMYANTQLSKGMLIKVLILHR